MDAISLRFTTIEILAEPVMRGLVRSDPSSVDPNELEAMLSAVYDEQKDSKTKKRKCTKSESPGPFEQQKTFKNAVAKPVRKTRKSHGWSNSDDELLLSLRRNDLTWPEIGKHFPGRSVHSLQCRYTKVGAAAIEWDESDDKLLKEAVGLDAKEMWARISGKVGKGAKACEVRWKALTCQK
ncbi:hypothetical protein G7K_3162-t1 [Saitoella complicata NRRL Y-17804]|uniref:Myb-like domain-containing protein n=2 Tax=Saitoella complicata (strain BCRC 22490 / CBS 7301 / JCM 7358 / NBRC 10748 / NRRL Y-17804) TaxID=698492 RepID=A0A0E9NH54_SAICN|nr:hypothetical protein G7K_3162-t1 [Saitoella complicata NRRL Y-17804]